jgi:hypothetical protein
LRNRSLAWWCPRWHCYANYRTLIIMWDEICPGRKETTIQWTFNSGTAEFKGAHSRTPVLWGMIKVTVSILEL